MSNPLRDRELLDHMREGFAYCRMVFQNGEGQDFICLAVNSAFETLMGLKDVVGKSVSQVVPGIREADPELFATLGRVALTGIPDKFEIFLTSLGMWFAISAYSPEKEFFVAMFDVITERKQLEMAFRDTGEKYRAVLETTLDGVWIVDDEGRLLDVNRAYCGLSGYSREELLGMSVLDLDARDSRADLARKLQSFAESGSSRFETSHRRKDGSLIDVEVSVVYASAANKYCVFLRDLTERKRAEEALRRSETYLAIAQGISGVGSWVWNAATGEIVYWSEENHRIWDLEGAVSYEKAMERIHPEDRPGHAQAIEKAIREQTDFEHYFRLLLPDGSIRFIHSIGRTSVRERDGHVEWIGAHIDITERRRAEAALRQSEERYKALFDRSLDCVYLCDFEGRFLDMNQAGLDVLGYRLEDLATLTFGSLMTEDQIPVAMKTVEEVLTTGRQQNPTEYRLRRKDGSHVYAETQASLIERDGKPFAIQGIARDITERKRAEEERAQLTAQLYQAQKMESIGRLAGGVAHDFNNLLTVINGYSQVLLRKLRSGDPLRATIEQILKAGEAAAALTGQLLAFSRKQVLQPRVLDLNRVVGEMRSMLARLLGEDVDVRVELHAESGIVYADPHQLEQVILNLAVNAKDAMPRGGTFSIETATVEWDQTYAQAHPEVRSGPYVLLRVSDSGVGMDEETRLRIFEPFFTTKEAGTGTGLGLSMVQGIVTQSGGYVEVSSEPGRGSTFEIFLPRLEQAAAEAEMPEVVPVLGGKETVLVVEDQDEVRKLTLAVLNSLGYRTLQAGSGAEALLVAENHRGPIHLLLTDVVMPHLTGKQLADRLTALRPETKVLYMSGYTADLVSLDPGIEYIQKPFTLEALALNVRKALGEPRPAAKVLVVDDEEGIRTLFAEILKDGGYEVSVAADGVQAEKILEAGSYDLVITDLVMPNREGIETIRALHQSRPGLKIIAVSGAFGGSFLDIAKALGANATLEKPVSPDRLMETVRETMAT